MTGKAITLHHVLVLIELDAQPSYGLEIMHRLNKKIGAWLRTHKGSIYSMLKELTEARLVTMHQEVSDRNHRMRSVYTPTGLGRRCARDARKSLRSVCG